MYSKSIGIIGGFGAYATLRFYKRILETFSSDNERNYPHIYMDNDFTMPSRTRALLYGDDYNVVVNMISESLQKMLLLKADYIILVCGTAHAFLSEVYKLIPEAKEKILNIIELLGNFLIEKKCSKALLIAAEGTLKQEVYETNLSKKLHLINPGEESFTEIRFFIETVKRNTINEDTYTRWIHFLSKFNEKNVILGCTEFPVLIESLRKYDKDNTLNQYEFFDPLEIVINELKRKMNNDGTL